MDNSITQFYSSVGLLIKKEREKRGFSQLELANIVGVGRTSITNIELGGQRFPLHKLWEISKALGVSIPNLIPIENDTKTAKLSPEISVKGASELTTDKINKLIGLVLTDASKE